MYVLDNHTYSNLFMISAYVHFGRMFMSVLNLTKKEEFEKETK